MLELEPAPLECNAACAAEVVLAQQRAASASTLRARSYIQTRWSSEASAAPAAPVIHGVRASALGSGAVPAAELERVLGEHAGAEGVFIVSGSEAVVIMASQSEAKDAIAALRRAVNEHGLLYSEWRGSAGDVTSLALDAAAYEQRQSQMGAGTNVYQLLEVEALMPGVEDMPVLPGPTPEEVAEERARVKAAAAEAKKARKAAAAAAAEAEAKALAKAARKAEKAKKRCRKEKCKVNIVNSGIQCDTCKLIFCLDHRLPESHGCGKAKARAVRTEAQRGAKQDLNYMRRMGTSQPPPKLTREQLKAKARAAASGGKNAPGGSSAKKKKLKDKRGINRNVKNKKRRK
ncbi:uncharacterized protein AMSG_03799 [Thecamonas trahens ATCC 50062]|uniref:AN1-type domain-containing protein n=1 Tax=Thecamonas trahens ATCC 50062 TaxID=461836 RepID=A0A0L0D540_THETB|nr:hypothetical protein AMSG_03799 [Thecamonas trahens ATCC 50062]KNC47365.1 hypothetical protein AMSG_03799 [Thecamonas trahens ATCC 50062]|eukprot:XP_013759703.1 hypothetical protein AMSG_03799 [Thecamonas trahens ATCC 50062]